MIRALQAATAWRAALAPAGRALAGLKRALRWPRAAWPVIGGVGGAVAAERGGAALARMLARQGSPSFPAAVAASVLLHVGLLLALLALQSTRPHRFDARSITVDLVAEDPAVRVGEHAGIAWDAAASQAAMATLLTARRDAALMSELVVQLVRRPHQAARSATAAAHPAAPPRPHAVLAAAPATPPPSAAAVELPVVAAALPDAPPTAPAATPPAAVPTQLADAAAPPRAEPSPPAVASPAPATASQPAAAATPASAAPAQTASAAAIARARGGDADRAYFDAVLKRLQRLRDYPGLARYHTSGKVEVAFRVARDGTVLTAEVHRSSGYSFLDKAGIDIIYRASPMPALPASLPGESWPIVVPISFRYD